MKFLHKPVSLLLALIMVLSIFTIVPISASAAEGDMVVLFTKPSGWDIVRYYCWSETSTPDWNTRPTADYYCPNEYNQDVYRMVLPGGTTGLIFTNSDESERTVKIRSRKKFVITLAI